MTRPPQTYDISRLEKIYADRQKITDTMADVISSMHPFAMANAKDANGASMFRDQHGYILREKLNTPAGVNAYMTQLEEYVNNNTPMYQGGLVGVDNIFNEDRRWEYFVGVPKKQMKDMIAKDGAAWLDKYMRIAPQLVESASKPLPTGIGLIKDTDYQSILNLAVPNASDRNGITIKNDDQAYELLMRYLEQKASLDAFRQQHIQ
ncbi:MAG: hypothetical protein NDI94_03220 [Candidatus Woesearchaeota archaeon]|nr:hypothetical protein [Candidatus Woesearchaeota archaeon]